MSEDISSVLSSLIDTYGIKILEDPDRLAQFLEDRCASQAEEIFYLTFALRYLLKCGWRPTRMEYARRRDGYASLLESHLGFSKEEASRVMELINGFMEEQYGNPEDDGTTGGKFIAVPGNLKKITGGISNRPRTMGLRRKSIYNGLVMLTALAMIAALFFQIGGQRTPVGDELRIAFFAPMSGPEARLSHVQLKAAQLAVERINRSGLLRGEYKLKVIGFDLPKDAGKAASAVTSAMSDRSILAMMLGVSNETTTEIARIADRLEAPLVAVAPGQIDGWLMDDDSASPYLYSFSLANDAKSRGKALAYFATQALKKKKAALYYNQADVLSSEISASAKKWLVGFGAEVAAELQYGQGSSGHLAAMKKAADSGADVLILPGAGNSAASIIAMSKEAGFTGTILAEEYTVSTSSADGAFLKGSWWIDEASALDPPIQSVLREYKSLYNEECPPEYVTAAILAYDGIKWIASVMQKAPGFRGEAIRHTLLATRDLPLTHTNLTIDPRTHMPLKKESAIVYCANDKGIFQRRFSLNRE